MRLEKERKKASPGFVDSAYCVYMSVHYPESSGQVVEWYK